MALACPKCGAATQVTRSYDDERRVVRLRICKRCGEAQFTCETYMNEMQETLELLSKKYNDERVIE